MREKSEARKARKNRWRHLKMRAGKARKKQWHESTQIREVHEQVKHVGT